MFVNNPIISIGITHSQGEERFLAFGISDNKRYLIIAFTLRGENGERIRIISSREQDKKEKDYYQKMKSEVKKKK